MKKRITALILALVMTCMLIMPASALDITKALAAADSLNALGLFNGTGTDASGKPIYDLNRAPTRQEAITMLVRLLGKEEEALAGEWETPFTDVDDWAKPYVGYAYANGLTGGTSATTFGGSGKVTAAQYITFVLRALGYSSETDFKWDKSWEYAYYMGICGKDDFSEKNNTNFKRGDAAILSLNAIYAKHKLTGESIMARLYTDMLKAEESAVDLRTMLVAASEEQRKLFASPMDSEDFEKYLVDDPSAKGLLTEAEITLLKTSRSTRKVTYEEAVADVELYFRAFKYGYGGYYYFGGDETFDAIKANVLADLEGKTTVHGTELNNILRKHISVIRDAHLRRAEVDKYKYYYCEGQNYYLDENGYYKFIDGEKWYYVDCDNLYVSMNPNLTKTGAIVYSPVWFYWKSQAVKNSSITLRCGDKTVIETINWIESQPYSTSQLGMDYKFLKENGIAYISIRSVSNRFGDAAFNDFINSGSQVKDAKAIIFDIRSNGGGSERYPNSWFESFTGKRAQERRWSGARKTELYGGGKSGSETYTTAFKKGVIVENSIPVIILADDRCASGGESTLKFLKTLNNAVVVGSQTSGCSICGNVATYYLPNSGVAFSFGANLFFWTYEENCDDIGFEPDIWCNPKTSLDAVLMMLLRNGLADGATVANLKHKLK